MTQRINVQILEDGKLRDATPPEQIAALIIETHNLRKDYCDTMEYCCDCILKGLTLCKGFSREKAGAILGKNVDKVIFTVVDECCKTCYYFKLGGMEDLPTLGFCLSPDDRTSFEIDDVESECKYWLSKELKK